MKKNIVSVILTVVILSGCYDDGLVENRLFIDAYSFKNELRVATDENVTVMSRKLTVSIAQPLSHDLEVTFVPSPELLETYRVAYNDPDVELLPEGHCDLSGLNATIKSGAVSSDEVSIDFVKLGEDGGLDYDNEYVLPVTIRAEGIEVLPSAKTMYFIVRKAALMNVAGGMMYNSAWPEWGAFGKVNDMAHFTMEAMLLVNGLDSDDKYGIKTIMGIEEKFLVRMGDAGLDASQIQVAMSFKDKEDKLHRRDITSPNMRLMKGRWYHFALTFDGGSETEPAEIRIYIDGKLKQTGSAAASEDKAYVMSSVDFMIGHSKDDVSGKPRCFWLGHSYNDERWFNGLMAEVRIWDKVLTEEEINAAGHFYKLYPDAKTGKFPESLIAYWKFDDGKGPFHIW